MLEMPAQRCQLRIQFDQRKAIPNIQELRKLQVSQVSASNNVQRNGSPSIHPEAERLTPAVGLSSRLGLQPRQ